MIYLDKIKLEKYHSQKKQITTIAQGNRWHHYTCVTISKYEKFRIGFLWRHICAIFQVRKNSDRFFVMPHSWHFSSPKKFG